MRIPFSSKSLETQTRAKASMRTKGPLEDAFRFTVSPQ
ncbi:hypothetical protein WN51_01410 [Melipona quadrifasciata]|uniref:Uncharacterized protein n=1 Tax=Melipona quadrifasciata TaxID=166423 RepID=A0A0N0BES9_9HYME|nr:hypothetical protein WN51_01410 [Melipona quadrifasciata]